MKVLQLTTGPVATNVWILADIRTREAIAIDTATPSLRWLTQQLGDEGWRLRFVISTHRHWDHIGDNAEVVVATGATLAVHRADRDGLEHPDSMTPPFPIPPSVPALDLAEGSHIRFGDIDLEVLHTPGHTEGSVCLLGDEDRILVTGDTLFAGGFGRIDLPGGNQEQMIESLSRLSALDEGLAVLAGHGPQTTIGHEKPWLSLVAEKHRLPW
ncbi:MAG TPA: MBL fold metallo-hydrolase [Candidatus Limnocylindrales bacterium]|nr:MBL fold metallo-hydrolase [Candidatus Limnocylindrales bacterium]